MNRLLQRDEAVVFLSLYGLAQLNSSSRADLLLAWWPPDDPRFALSAFPFSPNDFSEEIPDDPDKPTYNPVLLGGLAAAYYGVSNTFLQRELQQKGLGIFEVVGEAEVLYRCPCCGYRSLSGQEYDICKICYWEDDKTEKDDAYSSVNGMSLENYRSQFLKQPLPYEQQIRYLRDDSST